MDEQSVGLSVVLSISNEILGPAPPRKEATGVKEHAERLMPDILFKEFWSLTNLSSLDSVEAHILVTCSSRFIFFNLRPSDAFWWDSFFLMDTVVFKKCGSNFFSFLGDDYSTLIG